MNRIYVGTSSWADHTDFYPADLPKNQQITFYAQHFPLVEVNSSFYAMPPEHNFRVWAERTPPGFIFDVKPYKQLTWHDRDQAPTEEVFAQFRRAMGPMRQAGKLGAVTFQFPPWFTYRPDNLEYIQRCREGFPEDRLTVEFRHRSWLQGDHVPKLLDTLRGYGVGLVVVDEPQIGTGSVPTVLAVTHPDIGLVRFHGRNKATWYKKVERTADRFDYLYSEDELKEWVPQVGELARQAKELHVLFNNNRADYAVRNASQLTQLLQGGTLGAEVVAPASGAARPI